MSTVAPGSGVHAPLATWEMLNASASGTPGTTAPVAESVLMSLRLSMSGTKYGPSSISGRATQAGSAPGLHGRPNDAGRDHRGGAADTQDPHHLTAAEQAPYRTVVIVFGIVLDVNHAFLYGRSSGRLMKRS